ncbi:MAG: MATE family efflux transporter [bacterium]|nr:MATE family efflux transporter [bacterium]
MGLGNQFLNMKVEISMASRWSSPGGYREVLKIAGPMILSMGSWSLMHFIDRVFLTWFSADALAATLPAGLLSFAFGSFFIGTAGYVNTFVAQYYGAGRFDQIGRAVWQGIYFSVAAGVLMLALVPCAHWIFEKAGHAESIRLLEVTYFQILTAGIGATFVMSAASTFFSGRGDTMTVLWVNVAVVALNMGLDYAWIFGFWGFPKAGVAGAGYATVLAQTLGAVLFLFLMFQRAFRQKYRTDAWRFDPKLFARLWKFGAPNGLQFMVEVFSFTLFVLLVGRIGAIELAATNLAFNINSLAFIPLLGVSVAVSTLVGQYLGDDNPGPAERSTYSALTLTFLFMAFMAFCFGFLPEVFMIPFELGADGETFVPVRDMAIVLLRFVAVYCIADACYLIFSAAVKGAGDTRFVMWVTGTASVAFLMIPTYLVVVVFKLGLYAAWGIMTLYIALMGLVFFLRFRQGKWKSMRVIEPHAVSAALGIEAGEVLVLGNVHEVQRF